MENCFEFVCVLVGFDVEKNGGKSPIKCCSIAIELT